MSDVGGISVIASGLHHPEGVAVLPDGSLVCGSDHGRLYRIDPDDGAVREVAERHGALFLGVCVDGDGRILACDLASRDVVRWDGSTFEVLPCPAGGWRHPNALCFLEDGRLLVTDSGSWRGLDGRLVAISGPTASVVDTGELAFANGVCCGPDGQVWIAESADPAVSRYRIDGLMATRTAHRKLPGTIPDGVAALVDGTVLVGCYRPDRVVHVHDYGVNVIADDPTGLRLAGPTNMAFRGAAFDRVVVACFSGYHLAEIEAPAPGAPAITPSGLP